MEKHTHPMHTQPTCVALLLSDVPDDELEFFRRFVRRHGGALVPSERQRWYRLDFPPGTQQLPNDEEDPLMDRTYRVLYPDGASLIWYRWFVLDGVPRANFLLAQLEDEELLCEVEIGSREEAEVQV